MKVSWSERALVQLKKAHEYIARDNAKAAREFVEAAEALAAVLGTHPGIGIGTDERGVIVFPLVRYRYFIFYKILSESEVRIIRLRHMSRKRLD